MVYIDGAGADPEGGYMKVNGSWQQFTADHSAYFVNGGNSFGAPAILGTNDANYLALEANNTEAMRIFSATRNVAIGTTTDDGSKFSVSGSIKSTSTITSEDGSTGDLVQLISSGGNPKLRLFDAGAIDHYVGSIGGFLTFATNSGLTTYAQIRAANAIFEGGSVNMSRADGNGNSSLSMVGGNQVGNESRIIVANTGAAKWVYGVIQGLSSLKFAYNSSSSIAAGIITVEFLQGGGIRLNENSVIHEGAGSPESIVTAPPGSMYLNRSGGAGTTLYIKESGTGNTGWIAK